MKKHQVHSFLAIAWLFLIVILLAVAAGKDIKFSSSIFALLPESDQSQLVRSSTEQISKDFSRRVVLVLSGSTEDKVRSAVQTLAKKLTSTADVGEVFWRAEEGRLLRLHNELFPYRFAILDTEARQRLLEGEYADVTERSIQRIFSVLSVGQSSILDDPFGLHSTMSSAADLNFQVSNGLLKITDVEQPTYFLVVKLVNEPYEPAVQNRVLGIIQGVAADSEITIEQSGMLLHAAAGARQASAEISTIGLGSLFGIVVLVLFVFRQLRPLGLMLIPMSIGYVIAAAVTMLVFSEVHLVTFAFGAGLVGVSIDYALHYLCERRILASNKILPYLLPGLVLGLFSSVLAYAAQALAPFPGLRQIAVFSVSGLIAAWLTVVLWFPWLTRKQVFQPLAFAEKISTFGRSLPILKAGNILIAIGVVILILAVMSVYSAKGIDDIRLLQTSPKSLVAEEQKVRKTLGIESSSQFLLVKSTSIEGSLRKEEQLTPQLDRLKSQSLLVEYLAVSSVLPSIFRQEENLALVSTLYTSQLSQLFARLNLDEARQTEALDSFKLEKDRRLTSQDWRKLEVSKQWQNYIVSTPKGEVASVVRLNGLEHRKGREALLSLIEGDPDLIFVDQVNDITDLLTRFRLEIVNWVAVAYLAVFIMLLVRYKSRVWRIVLPPAIAALLTLGLLVQLEQGVNLFHLMALILVLGIGLDMGIFLAETDGSSHTWLAVSLSCITSLLAFGLLTLSKTPVLHHFGITVLIGLSLVWLLVLITRGLRYRKVENESQ